MHVYRLNPWLRFIEGGDGGGAKPSADEPNPGTDPAGTDPEPTDDSEIDWKARFESERTNSRKWESRAKENKSAADRLAELEEADKSEAQKAADRAAALERERDEIRTEALRWKIAARHGISDADAELFLTGKDEDTITAQAERLKAFNTQHGQQPNPNAGRNSDPEKGSVAAGAERYAERHQKTN